jgi:glutamate-1-semialdehyde 2,1-aminomutase
VTGRSKVLKIEGGYQGWHGDLGASTSPALDDPAPVGMPAAVPNSAGVLPAVTDALLVNAANDADALRERFARDGAEIAAMVVEPVLYSCGCVPVDAGYLALARELCTRSGVVLVFDEVLSGFRVVVGGAGSLGAGVVPDLASYGKALANGHVLSALVGRADLMDELAPGGPVFYSGTFNGHPLGVAAAQATLDELTETDALARAGALAARIATAIEAEAAELGIPARCPAIGTVFNLYLGATEPVRDYRALLRSLGGALDDTNRRLRHHLRARGIFIQRRAGTNRCFVSAAHEDADGDRMVAAIAEFLAIHQAELAS